MDTFDGILKPPTGNDSRLSQSVLNYEQKPMDLSTNYDKANGDHSMPQHIFPSDDESTPTTPSASSSPRNLIIDHQDDISKDGHDDRIEHRQSASRKHSLEADEPIPQPSNGDLSILQRQNRGLKRKFSLHEMTRPYLPQKRRHPIKSLCLTENQSLETFKSQLENDDRTMPLIPVLPQGPGPLRDYGHYFRLKPSTIPIKCFKCSSSNFENITQLRDHQKICLFKDKQRSLTNLADTKNNTQHTENRNSRLSSSKSIENINKTETSPEEKQKQTESVNICTNTTAKAKKRVFLCSACGTYYENWNLFLHMREVHKRHICLYCIGMFPSAERLTLHLEMKHDLEQNHFECQEKLLRSSRDTCYLMCCVCEHLFTEHEEFSDHKCSDHQQPCPLCYQKGRHTPNCKAGIHSGRLKHKDHHAKRKNKVPDKESNVYIPAPQKMIEPILNGSADTHNEDNSILRRIITDGDSRAIQQENKLSPAIINGCGSTHPTEAFGNGNSFDKLEHENIVRLNNNENNEHQISNAMPPVYSPPASNKTENLAIEFNQTLEDSNKLNQSLETSTSQSNTTSELTFKSVSSPEKVLNDSIKSCETSPLQDTPIESKPLLVPKFPKFTIKIPKEFQTPLESEQSSTESEDNEGIQSENEEQENDQENEEPSEGSDMDIEEDMPGKTVPNIQNNDEEERKQSSCEDNKSVSTENPADTEEEKKRVPPFVEPSKQELSSPVASPKSEVKDEMTEECKTPATEEADDNKPSTDQPSDAIVEANEDVPLLELLLDQPLDRIDMIAFMRICLQTSYRICLYCNHARRIAVNGHSFAIHLITQHRFSATVDSITAEELLPSTIVQKLRSFLPDLENIFFNLETYCSNDKENMKPYEKMFECFQCRFETRVHKELYLHNRKMHLKNTILCFMCRSNFFSYSEILCHMCPGMANKCVIFDIKFRCCLCDIDNLPSAFRLMVHFRKKHYACDVCLEDCFDQSRLSSHVWKHKLHHLCYRCGIAYRNKPDITKHLFWKHGTESVLCKRCLQKRWPHVYHFCIPPTSFVCEVCNLTFSKAMALKVHKRLHSGDAPYPCPEDDCDQKFISRKLLLKHTARHNEPPTPHPEVQKEEEKDESEQKYTDGSQVELENEQKKGDESNVEKNEEGEPKETPSPDQSKKKRKRSKRGKDNVEDDLMDLPAPNLSESDSSEESDGEKSKSEKLTTPVPPVVLSPPSEPEMEENPTDSAGTQIMDIWENFKTFQASQHANTVDNDSDDDNDDAPPPSILHVLQSDHDYCMMFKPISKLTKSASKDDLTEIKGDEPKALEHSTPKKKQKSPRKLTRTDDSDSSSSGSSSSSDSSCSCGSNCSCSSSSGSSSDSSSTSDSESSSSEGKRRTAARRAAKEVKKNSSKSDEKVVEEQQSTSPKTNASDIVDVVTTDARGQETTDPDSIILESDLETNESETDEDFYDEHPQKLANQLLAEKRKQLLMQTSLSPSHNFDIVENSRPSTPSIPEETVKEKKVKVKKKKRDKKTPKSSILPEFKLGTPPPAPTFGLPPVQASTPFVPEPVIVPEVPFNLEASSLAEDDSRSSFTALPIQQSSAGTPSSIMPAPITPMNRLSTGSSSDADGPLKRSKRRRRPNKFYGYSSDDDMLGPTGFPLSGQNAFKPTPPPNLTWRKEDLPAPSSKSSTQRSHKSPAVQVKKSTATNSPQLKFDTPSPRIPPIIIRPSAVSSKKSTSVEIALHKPPIVQPIRVPPVPVHHIRPPQYISPNRSFDDSDSSSDDGTRLTISTPASKKGKRSNTNSKQQSSHQALPPPPPNPKLPPPNPQHLHQPSPQHQPAPAPSIASASKPSVSIEAKRIPPALLPNPDLARIEYFRRNNIRYPIRPPAGARPPREGESVYCYCRCPYDEVSEMIACDGDDCMIEWFHFECVGILVPPLGKWFCPECRILHSTEAAQMGTT